MSSDVRFHHLAETSYKPGTELCFLQPKIESDMGQQCLVRSKHSGLSVRQSIQGAAGQDLRAATVQTPTWGGSPFMVAKIVTSLNLGLCLMHSNLLTLGCVKQSTAFIAGCKAVRMSNSCSRDLNSLMISKERFFKAILGVSVAKCLFSLCIIL